MSDKRKDTADAEPRRPQDAPHEQRWEEAVERAFWVERPAGGWPWQKPKGKKQEEEGA